MRERIIAELEQSIAQGHALKSTVGYYQNSRDYYLNDQHSADGQKWLYTTQSLISRTAPKGSLYITQLEQLIADGRQYSRPAYHILEKLTGLLEALLYDVKAGHLSTWEQNISAQNFDEFLDYAEHFHKGGKKMESSVIASAVLEDTLKRIAKKSELSSDGALEEVVNRLTEANVITAVKKKRIQSFAGVRNKALHAEWEEFDIRDVGDLIKGTRELIELLGNA
jgi:hypothetical protein